MKNVTGDPFKDRSTSSTSSSSSANSSISSSSVKDENIGKVAKRSFASRGAQFFRNLFRLGDSTKVTWKSSVLPDRMAISLLKDSNHHAGLKEVYSQLEAFPKKVEEIMRKIYREEHFPGKGDQIQLLQDYLDIYSATLDAMKGDKELKKYVSAMKYFVNGQQEDLNALKDPNLALRLSKDRLTTMDEKDVDVFNAFFAKWRTPQELNREFGGEKGGQFLSSVAKIVRHLETLPQEKRDRAMIEKVGWAMLMLSTSAQLKNKLELSDDWAEIMTFLKSELKMGSDGKIENSSLFQDKIKQILEIQPRLQDSNENKLSREVALNLCSMLQTNAKETWDSVSKCYVPSSNSQDTLYKIMMDREVDVKAFTIELKKGLKDISFRDVLVNDAQFTDLLKNYIKKMDETKQSNLAKEVETFGEDFLRLLGLNQEVVI